MTERQRSDLNAEGRKLASIIAGKGEVPDSAAHLLTGAQKYLSQAIAQYRDAPARAALRKGLKKVERLARELAETLDAEDVQIELGDHGAGLFHPLKDLEEAAARSAGRIEPLRGKRREVRLGKVQPRPQLVCAQIVVLAWMQCHDQKAPGRHNVEAFEAAEALWQLSGGPKTGWSGGIAKWEWWLRKAREGER